MPHRHHQALSGALSSPSTQSLKKPPFTAACNVLVYCTQAQSSSCQRTISTAAALTALCNNPNSPLSPTYYSGLQFPATPASSIMRPINLTSLHSLDPATGALTELDPATALVAPGAAAGPPVACRGVSRLVYPRHCYDSC
jgi:hypothetical protein